METSDRIGQKPQVDMWSLKTTDNMVFVLFSNDKDYSLLYTIYYRNQAKFQFY